jgi:hypothetical protein
MTTWILILSVMLPGPEVSPGVFGAEIRTGYHVMGTGLAGRAACQARLLELPDGVKARCVEQHDA